MTRSPSSFTMLLSRHTRRREFIAALGGAAAWPMVGRAQQMTAPVIGFLDLRLPEAVTDRLRGFRLGLKESGYVEGENLAIVYRWAENRVDRLPELATDLARRQVAAIVAATSIAAPAAKAATTSIPILFVVGDDPVRLGLVTNLSRPNGNITGINTLNSEIAAKRLEILRELLPGANRIAVLVNPADTTVTETQMKDVSAAARAMGLQIQILNADTIAEINAAFETMGRSHPDAVFVSNTAFLNGRRFQLTHLASFHRLPATYADREYTEVGGLMSYGSDNVDAYRQIGAYAGRILKGVKIADLPVVQANKLELVINAQTATMLGLTVPPSLLARADEVIE
jgi:putative tryptophan/tyrosine transport system substrate-binding protein